MKIIEKIISTYDSQAEFCRAIGMKPQFLTSILKGERKITPRYALAIEAATNKKVTRQQLRPDIYPD